MDYNNTGSKLLNDRIVEANVSNVELGKYYHKVSDLINFIHKKIPDLDLKSYVTNNCNGITYEDFKKPNSLNFVRHAHVGVKYVLSEIQKFGYDVSCENKRNIYVYNGRDWQSDDNDDVENLVLQVLLRSGCDNTSFDTPLFRDRIKDQLKIENKFGFTTNENPEHTVLNLENGVLQIRDTGQINFLNHDKSLYFKYCLNYAYKSEDNNIPRFQKYLDDVLPKKDAQIVLQELLGSVFTGNMKLEKIGMLLGRGANGKSVLLSIVERILGRNNISQVGFKDLLGSNGSSNNSVLLRGKLLNFASELEDSGGKGADKLKALASKEPILMKELYQNSYSSTDYGRLIFNANRLMKTNDLSYGLFRRLLIIPFDVTIPEEKRNMHPQVSNAPQS